MSGVVPGTQWNLALVVCGFGINFCPKVGRKHVYWEIRGFRYLA